MPMIIRPMLKRDKEHICAVHSDSLTKIHSVPISIDAMMAAINALRYPLFICVRPREGARIISSVIRRGNPFCVRE